MPASALPNARPEPLLDVAQLYDQHAPFIGRVLLRHLGEGTHVDDLLQETFIVAFRRRQDFDPERASPETWLYGIAANLCRRHHRGHRRFSLMRDRLAHDPSAGDRAQPGPDTEFEREESIALVQELVQKLPFKLREVFVLFELEGRGGAEIAAMVGIPIGTVWTRLSQARERFRKLVLRHERLCAAPEERS